LEKDDWAKRSAELTHIKTAKKGINIHTSITVMSSNTTPAGGATPSLAAMSASMMIIYASVTNPGITLSVFSFATRLHCST
jgi:hypothetical protein